jgi:hypothetical protein
MPALAHVHRAVRAAVAAIALPAVAAAQSPAADSLTIPRELLGALLDLSGARTPEILVGRLPDGFPAALADSSRAVMGGVSYGGAAATGVLTTAAAPDAATRAVVERMQRDGWTQPSASREFGGFVTSAGMRPTPLCRDSVALFVSAHARPVGGSLVQVMRTSARNAMCVRDPGMRRFEPIDFPIPALTPPPGVRTVGGGNSQSSSSGGLTSDDERVEERTVSTLLATALSPDSVVAHYAAQLAAAGWTGGAATRAEGVAMRVLTFRDDQGRVVQGVLTATALPGASERNVTLHVLRRARRR